ncbi:MAG: CehA/McbA family metallohydrolase, partial [Candidatus Latescibacterota bacterium]
MFPFILSYAETHYRPRLIPSLLFRKEPEILFDTPARVEAGRPIPLFLLVKDADRFPVKLDEVTVQMVCESGLRRMLRFPYGGLEIREPLWWDSFNLAPEQTGKATIHPCAHLRIGGKRVPVTVDNYPGTSKSPLTAQVSPDRLPTSEGWIHGDIHCHSAFTSDQVEFGAPLEVLSLAAVCLGLDWMAVTDHSYDLDDRANDYLSADPELDKWRLMREKANLLSDSLDRFTVIPGEEVTCRTRKGQNGHLLALNSERFIRGSGDSGERGLFTRTEHSIAEAAAACVEWGGLACAAHPLEPASFAERIILNRGAWTPKDLETPGITALQIHNGVRDRGFVRGMRAWIRLLLQGKRVYAFGGSDSHGDLNRQRAIRIPFLSLREGQNHRFGSVRTAVFAPSNSPSDIIEALRNGRALVTEGPFIDLTIDAYGWTARPGDPVLSGRLPVRADFLSAPEFGSLRTCRILAGAHNAGKETILSVLEKTGKRVYRHEFESMLNLEGFLYIRAECETAEG